jgi:hypothetical protein
LVLGETFRNHGWSPARIAGLTNLGTWDYVLAVGTVRRHFELGAVDAHVGPEDARAVDEFAAWLARRFPGVPAGTLLEAVTEQYEQIHRGEG